MATRRATDRSTRKLAVPGNWHALGRAVGLLLTLTLTACASYHAQPLQPQQSAQAFAARRLDSPALRDAITPLLPQPPAQWPPASWNRGDLLAVALVENPHLATARAAVAVALAHEITAAQNPNPTLGLQAEYALHDVKPWLYGISLDLPLQWPQQKHLQINLSRLATSNARWQLMNQTWAVRRQLVGALSDWEAARRRSQLLTRLVADQQRLVKLEKSRLDAGEDGPGVLTTERGALLKATQQLAEARAAKVSAQDAIAAALGLPPQALHGLKVDWRNWGQPPPLAKVRLKTAREQALLSRADLAAAINAYAAAENKLQLAIARQYPQFSLTPGYYWDHGISKFPLGVSFTLPIFNQNQGEIAEARAARRLAAQKMLALQDDIYGQIAGAERAEAIARDNVGIAAQQLQNARQQAHRAALGLRLGALDRGTQLAATVTAAQAALQQLDAQAQLQAARDALENALHTPLTGPELALRQPAPRTSLSGDHLGAHR